jgi:hypothetical protein
MNQKKITAILFCIIAALAAFGVFFNALFNGFIWDDLIVLRDQVSAFQSAKDIFIPPEGVPRLAVHYYRPLVILSYLIDKAIWGKSPFGFHLTIVLLHMLNTVLVFLLSRIILKDFQLRDVGAFIPSLIFAIHPIHTESVAWMAGRADVMAAFFLFLSLLLYLKFKEGFKSHWLILSSLVFFVACLSKEVSLSMILILPIIDISISPGKTHDEEQVHAQKKRKKKGRKKEEMKLRKDLRERKELEGRKKLAWGKFHSANLYIYIPFILAAGVYLIVRNIGLRGGTEKILQTSNLIENLKNIINSLGFYIGKVIIPINLTAFIPEIPAGFLTTLLSITALCILIASIIYSLVKKNGIVFFSISFFIITLLPSLMIAIMKISKTPLAERYLYIPSFAFSLMIGFIFLKVPSMIMISKEPSKKAAELSRFIIIIMIMAILLVFSTQTIKRNTIWKDDILFWEDLVKKVPDQGLPHLNLGLAYAEDNRWVDAEKEYRKAIDARYDNEGRATAYNNLGVIYLNRGDFDKTNQFLAKAISLYPNYAVPYHSKALCSWQEYLTAYKQGKKREGRLLVESIQHLNRAIQINPQYVDAHGLLGTIQFKLGFYEEARKHLKIFLEYEKHGDSAEEARKMLDKIPAHEEKDSQ